MAHENKLKQELYRQLFKFTPESGFITDSKLNLVDINKNAQDSFGLNPKKSTTTNIRSFFPEETCDRIIEHINNRGCKHTFSLKSRIRIQSGKSIPATIQVTPFTLEEEVYAGISVLFSEESGNLPEQSLEVDDIHLSFVKRNIAGITTTLELQPLLETMLLNLVEFITADKGMILTKDKNVFRIAVQSGLNFPDNKDYFFPVNDAIVSRISSIGKSVFTDTSTEPDSDFVKFLKSHNISSFYCVPVFLKDNLEGILLLGWSDTHQITENEITLSEIVSGYCSLAILNNRLVCETKRLKEDLETKFTRMPIGCIVWNRDLQAVSWNPEAEKIFGYKKDEALGKNMFELIIPENNVQEATRIHQQLLEGEITDHRETSNITKSGETIYCEWSSTPLRDEQGNIYSIISMVKDITEKKELDRELGRRLEELTKKTRYEEVVRKISSGVHKSIDLDQVMENAANLIFHNIRRADTVAIYLVEGNEAVMRSHRGYPEWFIQKVRRIPHPKGFTWKTILEGKPLYVEDVEKDDAIGQAGRDVGTKSYLSIPLKHESEVVGVININSFSTEAFTKDEMNFFESMSNHVEIAIGNARKVETIRQNELRFSSFMDNLPGVVFIKDTEGKHVYTNRKFEENFGMKPGYVQGKTDHELWPPDIAQQFIQNDRKVLESREDISLIEDTIHNDRKQTWIVNKFLLYDNAGKPAYVAGIAIDITERNEAFQRLREQAKLLDIASDAIIVVDMESRIKYWNKSAERLYGWNKDEVAGEKPTELVTTDIEDFKNVLGKVKEKGEWTGELQQKTKDGRTLDVESRWTLVKDKNQNPVSVFIVNTDISDKKNAEKQLMQAQRMESIGTLAGGIAHDLNNVLQPILMSIQLLRDVIDSDDTKHQNWIDILEDSAQRGAGLVNQVLSFARGAEGEQAVLYPGTFLKEITKILKQTFPKSIQIKTDFPQDLWQISANLTKLHQVVMNLCVNARDAMLNGGTLKITAENLDIDENYASMNVEASTGPYVVISVSDTGTGIPQDNLEKMFDPFYTTKEPGKGTGLGLSIAFSIVKDHGGFIRVSSEIGAGSVFKVYLPAIEHPQINELKTSRQESQPKGSGETVLLVDDESSVLDITRLTLETNGYEVVTAADGAEAVVAYMNNMDKIDVVIMDMMMPVMDGVSSIRTLHRINPDVKIIASSGFSDDMTNLAKLSDIKIKEYLTKPYKAETLLKTLNTVIGKS